MRRIANHENRTKYIQNMVVCNISISSAPSNLKMNHPPPYRSENPYFLPIGVRFSNRQSLSSFLVLPLDSEAQHLLTLPTT